MKKQSLYAAGASSVYFLTVLCMPVVAAALPDSPVIISEVQPGTALSASQEFIELYNVSDEPVDLTRNKWRIAVASSTATDWAAPYRTIPLNGIINPGASYVVSSSYVASGMQVPYLHDIASGHFSAGLSAGAGHLRLSYIVDELMTDGSCVATEAVADIMEWSTVTAGVLSTPSLEERAPFELGWKSGIVAPATMQRIIDIAEGTYADHDEDNIDFILEGPSPGALNVTYQPGESPIKPITIAPRTDTCGPNAPEPPSDTGPTEPSEQPLPPSDDSTDGSGSDGGNDDAEYVPNAALTPPRITELYPNPAAPQTDAGDEFIELYNPNDMPYDMSGFIVEAGGATMRRYTMPAGTLLPPHAYLALYARDTGISLPNGGGSARLLDAAGLLVMAVPAYGAAPDGQAWTGEGGVWQWTTTPTPNTVNTLTLLTAAVKKAAVVKQPTKKTTAAKTASAAKTKTTKPKAASTAKQKKAIETKAPLTAASASARAPIHTGVLAAVGIFALLYGAYEYRHDVANKIHQLRTNRAARRAHRQAVARR